MSEVSIGITRDLYDALYKPSEIRARCHEIGEIAINGNGHWFAINSARINSCVKLIEQNCRNRYPELKIPIYSLWREWSGDQGNNWDHRISNFAGDPLFIAKSAIDLVFFTVLLGRNPGNKWYYSRSTSGQRLQHTQAIAAAGIDLFFDHFSSHSVEQGWVLGMPELQEISRGKLATALQSSTENPFGGLSRSAIQYQKLAAILKTWSDSGIHYQRPGDLVDECLALCSRSWSLQKQISMDSLFELLAQRFAGMIEGGLIVEGMNTSSVGDCGWHSGLLREDHTSGVVPFHRALQWLCYSLIEPLALVGITVTDPDTLTGLADVDHAGLFIDTGVLSPHDIELMNSSLTVDSEAVVEWRALTIYLQDRVTEALRKSLKLSAKRLPLSAVMQGGMAHAGTELSMRIRGERGISLHVDTSRSHF